MKQKSLVGQVNIGIPAEFNGNSLGASTQINPPSLETWKQATKGKQVHSVSRSSVSDRKYNLVIYGIPECDKGTPRSRRLKTDTINVSTVITNLDCSIHRQCVRDCFRLGEYSDNGRPWPILAKQPNRQCFEHSQPVRSANSKSRQVIDYSKIYMQGLCDYSLDYDFTSCFSQSAKLSYESNLVQDFATIKYQHHAS